MPVIIFTGKDQEVDRSTCVQSGADAYIPKSLGVPVLLAEIQRMLNGIAPQPPTAEPGIAGTSA